MMNRSRSDDERYGFWHHLNLEFMPYLQKDKLGEIVTSRDLNEQKLVTGSIYASVFIVCQYLARTGYHQYLTGVSQNTISIWF